MGLTVVGVGEQGQQRIPISAEHLRNLSSDFFIVVAQGPVKERATLNFIRREYQHPHPMMALDFSCPRKYSGSARAHDSVTPSHPAQSRQKHSAVRRVLRCEKNHNGVGLRE